MIACDVTWCCTSQLEIPQRMILAETWWREINSNQGYIYLHVRKKGQLKGMCPCNKTSLGSVQCRSLQGNIPHWGPVFIVPRRKVRLNWGSSQVSLVKVKVLVAWIASIFSVVICMTLQRKHWVGNFPCLFWRPYVWVFIWSNSIRFWAYAHCERSIYL